MFGPMDHQRLKSRFSFADKLLKKCMKPSLYVIRKISMFKIVPAIILLCVFVFGQEARAFVRLDTDVSYRILKYDERRDQQSFLNSDFALTGVAPRFRLEAMVFPTWFTLGAEIEYFSPLSSDSDNSFKVFKQSSQAAVIFNSRPFMVSLVAEQFYQDFKANNKTFGYNRAQGLQYYPVLDFVFPAGSRFFIKYPLLGSIDGKEELTVGLHLRFQGSDAIYPLSLFQSSFVFKIEYSEETLKFRKNRGVDIITRSYIVGFGYNF